MTEFSLVEKTKALSQLLHGVKGTFCCFGTAIPENEGVIVKHISGKTILFKSKFSGGRDVDALAALAPQAPFGQGKVTKYDTTVRDAKQFKFADGKFSIANFDPAKAGILDIIKAKLLPHDPSPISAELYNLNIYQRDGHFKAHRDTPRGPHMIGTLVVCLPSDFHGGKFIVKHRECTMYFDWAEEMKKTEDNAVWWTAFFGDCEHQIDKVEYGNRVTLSYNIMKETTTEVVLDVQSISGDTIIQEIKSKLQEYLQDITFMPKGGVLGCPCGHLYTNEPTFTKPLSGLSNATAMKLKGTDQKLGLAALSAGLHVSLSPFLQENRHDYEWKLDHFPKSIRIPQQTCPDELVYQFPVADKNNEGDRKEKIVWIEARPKNMAHENMRALLPPSTKDNPNPNNPALLNLGESLFSMTGNYGNEASYTYFYIYTAILITIPPVTNGVREPSVLPVVPGEIMSVAMLQKELKRVYKDLELPRR